MLPFKRKSYHTLFKKRIYVDRPRPSSPTYALTSLADRDVLQHIEQCSKSHEMSTTSQYGMPMITVCYIVQYLYKDVFTPTMCEGRVGPPPPVKLIVDWNRGETCYMYSLSHRSHFPYWLW